ncbi:MAG: hypothetical protein ACO3F2_04285 [Roseiflexaceae bacterium]
MTNEQQHTPETTHTHESTPAQESGSLAQELRTLGSQLETVVRAFLESNRAHSMQQELQKGVNELVQKLQSATTSEPVAEASEKGKQLVEKALENPAVTEAHAKVVKGLSNLNEELRKMATSLAEDKHSDDNTQPKSE